MTDNLNINKSWIIPLIEWLKNIESMNYQWSLSGYNNAKLGSAGLYCKLATIFQKYHKFDKQKLYNTIQQFKTSQGIFYNTPGRDNVIAETRQAMAGLINIGYKIDKFDTECFYQETLYFMNDNYWNFPYNAGAQLSHYLFFCGLRNKKKEIRKVLMQLSKYKHPDGWYFKRPNNPSQIINGIMKIMTGLDAIDLNIPSRMKKSILDYLLGLDSSGGGCNIYDYVYALTKCMEIGYKKDLCQNKLLELYNRILEHQQEDGGFSYNKNKSQTIYYGNNITNGSRQGDIHGTTVFCMALARIDKYLGLGLNLVLPIS